MYTFSVGELIQRGRKERIFYLTTHSAHFLRLYGVGHMVKDPLHGLLFSINSNGSLNTF